MDAENPDGQSEAGSKPPKASRACGACNLCCKLTPIWEISRDHPEWSIDKRRNQWCQHAIVPGGGCAIYREESKPLGCHLWRCEWLRGFGREEDRPDRIGCVISLEHVGGIGWSAVLYWARAIADYPPQKMAAIQAMVDAIASKTNLAAIIGAPHDLSIERTANLRDGRRVFLRYRSEPIDRPERPEIREEALAQLDELGVKDLVLRLGISMEDAMETIRHKLSREQIERFLQNWSRKRAATNLDEREPPTEELRNS